MRENMNEVRDWGSLGPDLPSDTSRRITLGVALCLSTGNPKQISVRGLPACGDGVGGADEENGTDL